MLGIFLFSAAEPLLLFPLANAKCHSPTRKKQDSGSEFDLCDESDSDPNFFDERPNPEVKLTRHHIYRL